MSSGAGREKAIEAAERMIKIGNSFVSRAFIVFALIHYFILPRPPVEVREINWRIGRDQRLLEEERLKLSTDLEKICEDEDQLEREPGVQVQKRPGCVFHGRSSQTLAIPVLAAAARLSSDSTKQGAEAEQKRKSRADLRSQRERILGAQTKLEEDWLLFDKGKIRRELKIPGTDVSMGETDIKDYYPLALSLTLLVLFWHRRRVLEALAASELTPGERGPDNQEKWPTPPIWAAPIPLGRYGRLTHWQGARLNFVGLTALCFCFLQFVRFAYRDEFYRPFHHSPIIFFINIFAGALTAVAYVSAVIHAMRQSRDSNEMDT